MDQGPKFPMKVRFEYEVPKECPIYLIHGVWGGITPHGEIEMNLYTESDKLPPYSEREIGPDGSIGPEVPAGEGEDKVIVRRVHGKALLSYQTARAIIEWLEGKIEALELEGESAHFLLDDDGPDSNMQ